ncbi:MAG: hypothetical protein ACKOCD_06785 [Nitrospiraceae bacterium]
MPICIDLAQLDAKLRRWRKKHNTLAKVAAAHRSVLLQRVVESMAFENQPVSMDRLKVLFRNQQDQG